MTTKAPHTEVRCPLCDGTASVLSRSHPGYRAPDVFTIAECSACDAQFALPLCSDGSIYEDIYRSAATLPGYARYAWFAERVRHQRDPLGWLARREEMYWFVRSALQVIDPGRHARVIEIGSGLGYLTYAMSRAGWNVRGLDVSARAVERASARFGHIFDVAGEEARPDGPCADIVVAAEVVEHVPDPTAFVTRAAQLLAPGGHLLLTTPNKSAHPRGSYWRTDNPPVHLWWLSEAALLRIAQRAALEARLWDFTAWWDGRASASAPLPAYPPYLGANGAQIHPPATLRRALELAPRLAALAGRYRRARSYRVAQARLTAQRSPTLAAVLRRGERSPASDVAFENSVQEC